MGSKLKNDKYIIFDSQGGHGKQIMATAVIRALKKKYSDRKILWITSWDGPAFYNPNIFRFYLHGQMQYFYDDFVKPDTLIFKHEVYHSEDHIHKRKHLTQSWCDMFNIPYDGYEPELYLNPRELEIARDKIKPDGRPIMLLQTHGGSPQQQYSKKSWFRDMPIETAKQLVEHYKTKYRILHLRSNEQPHLEDTEQVYLPLRELYAIFPLSTKRIFIDSFAQHIAAALKLQSTVIWIGNKPEVFGYPEHINILPNAKYIRELNKFSYLEQFELSGQIQQFPFDKLDVINIDDIINAVDRQK